MNKKMSIGIVIAIFIVGFIVGNIAYNLYNAKVLSYLTSDSAACNNCHVMNEVFNDHSKSPHKDVVCIDCHLPHSFIAKWIGKAQSGLGHAYYFTFDKNLPTHFSANQHTKKWVQDNCIRCHGDYATNAINPTTNKNHSQNALNCVSCHQNVGHLRDF
ncbi:cytochrome c nitrite reductase small subunit [Helicobacter fennelliae]|uniref:Cytochrome c nitrite reductase, small subunit NrfH n=2 Tax=Helicobacter fennelliae TaxID=215 RepID=T1D0K7_9HELI|nr:cytochrome c nitrite reductase small subunit [Helicobacter fennelliae]GAD19740.1 cytochrome c nitrite reductase, small subunit NrfH [Helicobacter fennelliae MRY12-0050]SQB99655.1 cytochrome c-type protein [Helicobacter fennelliae]STP07222.1 cytochrome c-type protein [Helicobacter fennelliae]STQ85194.1 cytochrome c-type protein [Helicobacter fennelliae]